METGQSEKTARLEKPVRITEQVWPVGTMPLVSIRCITYQHVNFIREAIEGFLMQETTFPVEILIHDDASTDGTADIVKEYAERYPKLFWTVLQTENQWSKGVRPRQFLDPLVRGEFVALCEGDDYWTSPHKLQIQVEALAQHPRLSCCIHQTKVVDECGSVIREENFHLPGSEFDFYDCLTRIKKRYATCSMVYRADALQDIRSWFSANPNDMLLELQLAIAGNIIFIDKNMGAYRRHSGGVWSSKSRVEQTLETISRYDLLLRDVEFSDAIKHDLKTTRNEHISRLCMKADCKSVIRETNPLLGGLISVYEQMSKVSAVFFELFRR